MDHAKGFCVTLVVMMHSTLGVGEAMGAEGFLHTFVAFAKPFRMPDFFMIAGLFLCRTINRDWRTFIDRKVAHFAYFYLLWFAIQWIFKGRLLEGPSASAAIDRLALGLVEPFGTLWFIYLLPIFFVVTKLLRHAPATAVLFAAALLETARIRTGWTIPDEFAARYVYFLFGYIFAPRIFALAEWASSNPAKATVSLFVWACCNSALVFSPAPLPDYPNLADLPVVSLVAGIAGAGAVVVFATLLSLVAWNSWLEYCGRNSIVIYLSFFLPMAVTRTAITTFHLVSDVGTASLLVTLAGVTIPIVLHRHVRNGRLRFLFERPERFSLSSLKAISTTL
ncbi:acyltransferase family protein [Methylosinus sp. Sm6]|uniref:acyltransferase family protein n=1 Tax=Methylosinus sp. Sm6 TaxID=2866948 RepID=UPI00351D5766